MKKLQKIYILALFPSFLILLSLLPHPSSQLPTINNSSTIEATCIYAYDQHNRYSCELLNAVLSNPNDVLVVSGTHMPRHSDIDVEALTHVNASFAQFNGEALRKFINLKFIDLRRVGIITINENAFEVCGHLEELHMGFNGFIEGLPQGMLRNCGNLRIFWAPDLRVLSLPENLFGGLRSLEVFDMSSSPLRSFPDNLLQNMTNLRTFRIPGNFVSFLHPNNFLNAANFEEINISWNNLSNTQEVMNILNGHLGLKRIIISNNYFEIFDFNFLTQFQRLEELSIGGRPQMSSISWQFLPSSLVSLTVLQVGENIPENAFERLQNLTFLWLTGSGITNLQQDTFKDLRNLEQLQVTSTNITTLHPQLFASQASLRALVLYSNQIEDLPDGIFEPLVNLGLNVSTRCLDMWNNRIQRLQKSAFGHHPFLDFIDFAHNDIDEIERGIFGRFSPIMSRVDFGFNRCISNAFWNVTNVDEIESFQPCFDNFDGTTTVPTTTPNAVIFVSFAQESAQQGTNIIETHCILSFDPQGNYNCYLFNVRTNSSTDVLDIVGSHLPNLTDADVHAVIHRDCFIKQFNGEVLRKFNNLKKLDLRLLFLESISFTAFEACGQLEELNIGINPQLLELPLKMLANCGNLKIFSAVSSKFLTLPGDIFGSGRNLEVFDVSHGRLSSLPDELFQNMTNLKVFNIWNCQLTRINTNLFENVLNLEEVELSGNQLSSQQEVMDLLDGQLQVKKISISYNSFPMFNLSFFAQFENLEELSFGGNQNLTDIDWQSLPSFLRVLKTYQIGEEIPENAFEGLPNLTHFYVSGIGITTLHKDTFKPLTNLDRLEIVNTRLSTLHPQLFTSQLNLSYLSLNFNEIEELPVGVFAPLVNLGHKDGVEGLFMVMNKLHTLPASLFGQHPQLRYIDFSYNKINKIERGIFSRFHPVPAIASFTRNECIDWPFSNEGNLDEHKNLELCFNNYDGIPTTTPSSAWNGFRRIQGFVIIFVGFLGFCFSRI